MRKYNYYSYFYKNQSFILITVNRSGEKVQFSLVYALNSLWKELKIAG